jgi:sigma-B regulation protein RsbU (phosphoserine phosphatase)
MPTTQPLHESELVPRLELFDESAVLGYVPLDIPRVLIGRAANANLRLDHDTVSRLHAELVRDPFGRWHLRDLGSRNGIAVNGAVYSEAILEPGDTFQIGRYYLRLLQAGPPRETHEEELPSIIYDDEVAPPPQIGSPPQSAAARIETCHLATLTEFGSRLLLASSAVARMDLLCRLMVRKDFHARSAGILRLFKDSPHQPAQVVGTPVSTSNGPGSIGYVSAKLLAAVRRTVAPTLASNMKNVAGAIELSLSAETCPLAAIACPVRVSERSMDVLYLTLPPEYGTSEWLALVALAAQQFQQAETTLAVRRHVEAGEHVERELARARKLQQRLLPGPLDIEGLDVTTRFEPCRWVGGDYADVVRGPDGRAVLVVADTSGKGLSAALIASHIHAVMRASIRAGADVASAVQALNDHLLTITDDGFVTLVALSLDVETGEIELVNTGHRLPVVIDPAGGTRTLADNDNFPLGITPQMVKGTTDRLEPGHLLAMFTDGVWEMTSESGRMLGVRELAAQLQAIFRAGPSLPTEALATRWAASLDRFRGNQLPSDDRAFVLARRKA